MLTRTTLIAVAVLAVAPQVGAVPTPVFFEAAGANAAAITPQRDSFRAAIGGGVVAGANGSFGGVRREINWDGVRDTFADPNLLPACIDPANLERSSGRGILLMKAFLDEVIFDTTGNQVTLIKRRPV